MLINRYTRYTLIRIIKIIKTFLKELAISLHFLLITAKRRFFYKTFSFLQGLKSWYAGFKNLLDIFIGIPAMNTKNYSNLIRKDLTKFLLAEITFDVNFIY